MNLRCVKFKCVGGRITLQNPLAVPGRDGRVATYLITEVPPSASLFDVTNRINGTYFGLVPGRFEFDYREIGVGRIVRPTSEAKP